MMYNVGLQYAVLKIYKEFPFFFWKFWNLTKCYLKSHLELSNCDP